MVFLFLALIAISGCLWNARLRVDAELCGLHMRLCLTVHFWYGKLSLRRMWRFPDDLEQRPAAKRRRRRKNVKEEKVWRTILRSATDIKTLDVAGEIGMEADAAATALLCGMLQMVLRAACARKGLYPTGDIRPVFGKNVCRIKVESILVLHVAQIIPAALRRAISKIRGEHRHATSNRKHHADLHGTA